uniref:Uncharacterized protein n=1 Tax=Rangifer tarandus platyrhynchus TaxID=3082113 RepID=A0ACB0E9C0_RANTA|nr:unnamed protein product [Rangifer tarandus platyrhynchus]
MWMDGGFKPSWKLGFPQWPHHLGYSALWKELPIPADQGNQCGLHSSVIKINICPEKPDHLTLRYTKRSPRFSQPDSGASPSHCGPARPSGPDVAASGLAAQRETEGRARAGTGAVGRRPAPPPGS